MTIVAVLVGFGAYVWDVKWLQVPLVAVSALLGYAIQFAFAKHEDEEQLQQDVVALTAIYYQSPLIIRDMLRPDAIDRAIQNLLNAALGEEAMGDAFWEQSVAPFIHKRGSGYKRDWRYQIDLIDLGEDQKLSLNGHESWLSEAEHRQLHTTVTYEQTVANPADLFYIAAVFDGASLPQWFKRENFWLREVTELPAECIAGLSTLPATPELLPSSSVDVPAEVRVAALSDETIKAAQVLLSTSVMVGEQAFEPAILYLDCQGVSWGFELDSEALESLRNGAEIHVELKTFVPKTINYFPVHINAPTQHPTVHFNYACTSIPAGGVSTEIFFSAERPYDARLRSEYPEGKRIVVRTEPGDWVFRGSGCMFHWAQGPSTVPSDHATAS